MCLVSLMNDHQTPHNPSTTLRLTQHCKQNGKFGIYFNKHSSYFFLFFFFSLLQNLLQNPLTNQCNLFYLFFLFTLHAQFGAFANLRQS